MKEEITMVSSLSPDQHPVKSPSIQTFPRRYSQWYRVIRDTTHSYQSPWLSSVWRGPRGYKSGVPADTTLCPCIYIKTWRVWSKFPSLPVTWSVTTGDFFFTTQIPWRGGGVVKFKALWWRRWVLHFWTRRVQVNKEVVEGDREWEGKDGRKM